MLVRADYVEALSLEVTIILHLWLCDGETACLHEAMIQYWIM